MGLLINVILAIIVATVIPLSLIVWLVNVVLYSSYSHTGFWEPLSPFRCLLSVVLPLFIAQWGLKRKSMCRSGAFAGAAVGFILTISNYSFIMATLAFFMTASKLTKLQSEKKRAFEEDFKHGGQRDWVQVLCNGGVATELAVLYMAETGCGEFPIDFSRRYMSSWLAVAALGSLASACGDTYASEVGSVYGGARPFLITTLRRVPAGTNGAVSLLGTLVSGLGGFVVAIAFYLPIILCQPASVLSSSYPQWPLMIVGTIAGFIGSGVDSLLGATLQFSGYDEEKKCIVEHPRPGVHRISGIPLLGNHSVNLIASAITALVTPGIAIHVWQWFT